MIDTVFLDTSVIGYLIYHSWYGQQTMEEYVNQCVEMYEKIPFYRHPCKDLLWVGDSKPYFRKLINRTYKGGRPPKEKDLDALMQMLEDKVKPLRYPHFEADDLIALYVNLRPKEEILVCTVDSDLLQVLREPVYANEEGYLFTPLNPDSQPQGERVQGQVTWCCLHGYEPQLRRISDGTFQTWFEHKLCASKKKLRHLDINNPRSVIDWKVIMGDTSDTISPGEAQRWMIDLANPPEEWNLLNQYPEFLQDADSIKKPVVATSSKPGEYFKFRTKTNSNFPTAQSWALPRAEKQWKKLQTGL